MGRCMQGSQLRCVKPGNRLWYKKHTQVFSIAGFETQTIYKPFMEQKLKEQYKWVR